ncbi:unnamed protein product [Porites lobata]|uniref:Transposase Helix-turn-helix domain-containing protein n=1 Tax=Porites lobata TaxID=104759 RepID=A0ABN8S2Y9_9CNID|nr:unnamed protein product [Porites lobata]
MQFEQLTREMEVKLATGYLKGRPGPERKLRLEQEFLLTLMKLRLALLTFDLGFRFHVSASTVSSVFITWVKLMSKELSVLIVWPSRQQIKKKTLPYCFKKLYPKVRSIGRLKVFLILKNELPITLLPLADDIVRVCCALCNLLPPLCV